MTTSDSTVASAGSGPDGAPNGSAPDSLTVAEAAALVARMLDEVGRAVVGKRNQVALVLAGLVADGHILLDDLPGVARR
jgi:MoxR-like ATPase